MGSPGGPFGWASGGGGRRLGVHATSANTTIFRPIDWAFSFRFVSLVALGIIADNNNSKFSLVPLTWRFVATAI